MCSSVVRILILIGLLWIVPAHAATDDNASLYLGSVAMDSPPAMHRRLLPLTDYLSRAVGLPVILKLSANMHDAVRELATNGVQLAYLTPVAYIKARDQGGSRVVAKTITNGAGSFQLMIVVREDSPIRSVEDLAGRSFAFGDPGALLQQAVVVKAGMPLGRLGKQDFLGHYDNIARAVIRGFYDAGILKDTAALKWQGKGLRVLHASPALPPYNIAASGRVDDATLARLREAFLRLDPADAAHRAVIKALDVKYDGFAAADDAEYDVVRDMITPFRGD